jgi:tripartite-type tricarboxylate transporter receptor subunit TctC
LGEELGRSVVIDNRAGASGTIGAGLVSRAAPDGATLLFNTSIQVILPHLMKLPYDSVNDFTGVGQINAIPFVLVVNKDLAFRTVADLVSYASKNPGTLNFASNSSGSASHLAAEQFKSLAGIQMTHIPYKGSAPAITDLIAGQVQLMFEQGPSVLPFLKSGQLRALAVTSPQRTTITPDVPTFAEAGYPAFVYSNWQGVWAPRDMPPDVSDRLIGAFQRTLERPEVHKKLLELGTEPARLTGKAFDAFVRQQNDLMGQIVKSANVKLD